MSESPVSIRRRKVIKGIVTVSGVALLGTGLIYAVRPDVQNLANRMTRVLQYPDLVKDIGKQYANAYIQPDSRSVEQVTRLVLNNFGWGVYEASFTSSEKLESQIMDTVHEDFAKENIAIVGGWVLSKTEAQLCALVYLSPEGS